MALSKEKQKILNELGFFPRLNKVINDINYINDINIDI